MDGAGRGGLGLHPVTVSSLLCRLVHTPQGRWLTLESRPSLFPRRHWTNYL